MKKYILSFFTGLACLATANEGNAQSFTVDADTVKFVVYSDANVHNNITNVSSGDIQVRWKVLSHDFPANWQENFGICDNVTCYGNNVLTGGDFLTDTFKATEKCDLHLQLNLANSEHGEHFITMELKDEYGTQIKNITFNVVKYPTNIKIPRKSEDNIVLYPNPARGEVNVDLNTVPGVRNLAIYNIIGKVVDTHRVTGNNARIDISALPQGVYIMRLMDARGRIITTRKFMHQ